MTERPQRGTVIEVTVLEHRCRTCYGQDSSCECNRGFNLGMRWSAYEGNPDDFDPIAANTSKKLALEAAYDHAFDMKAAAIRLITERYSGERQSRVIQPRFIHQRSKAALRAEYEQSLRNADVMVALWTLNRVAKRDRDHLPASHSFDRYKFYENKNQALAHLLLDGKLVVSSVHKIGLVYAELLRSESGYSFHRPVPPPENDDYVEIGNRIEAKSPDSSEYDPVFAQAVVEYYLKDKPVLPVYRWPDTRTCFLCGAQGHIAARCPTV
jgi:hypothetical protein